MVMRICRTCGEAKNLSEYWKQSVRSDGLQSSCKSCMRASNNAWQRDHHASRHASKLAQITNARRSNQVRALLKGAKDRARRKGLEFNLTSEDIPIPSNCPILGIPMRSVMGMGRKKGQRLDSSPSIDRIDNSQGYVRGNVVVVSYRANRIKSDATVEELQQIVEFYHDRLTRCDVSRRDTSQIGGATRGISGDMPSVLAFEAQEGGSLSVGESR